MRYLFFIVLFLFSFNVALADCKTCKNIAIISTGGTIVSKYNPKLKGEVATLTGEELLGAIPQIKKIANIKKVIEVSKIDSSDMSPEIWLKLAKTVDSVNNDPKIDGILILHGTDTLEDTSYFINLLITPKKPIVFTGSMRSASEKDSDGPRNIKDSLVTISSKRVDKSVVMVVMNGKIMSAYAVKKVNTSNVDAFSPGYFGLMGIVDDLTINMA